MITVVLAAIIFLQIIKYIIFFDVLLSWLLIFGIQFRPHFIASILDPTYKTIQKIIPTRVGPLDLTPIVCILLLFFVHGLLIMLFPEVQTYIHTISSR